MKKGGNGGERPQKAGGAFEGATLDDLLSKFEKNGYRIVEAKKGNSSPRSIKLENQEQNRVDLYFKAAIHKEFFEPKGIFSKDKFSARLEPDTAIYSSRTNILTIIEKKQQTGSGSVAEKLQTCDYKLMYYNTLCNQINVNVDLIWQLGPYFVNQKENLRSVYEYMLSKGSRYFFGEIPFNALKI